MKSIRLIFGDQLSLSLASLENCNYENDLIVMMEVKQEADALPHHKRKLLFLFSAMRHFEQDLKKQGFKTRYYKLDDSDNLQSFQDNLRFLIDQGKFDCLHITELGEYRLQQEILTWEEQLEIPVKIYSDKRFYLSKDEFADYAKDKNNLLMENFYRFMRKNTSYLMEQGKPLGGKWNFDSKNRNRYDSKYAIPQRPLFPPDAITKEVITLLEKYFDNRFGSIDNFQECINREQALECLEFFAVELIPHFGTYQDAMVDGEKLLFHSRISHLINCGLLTSREVCERVLKIPIDNNEILYSIEGFIRQVIGWREYIRGIYWLKMPDYLESNHFNANRSLPDFYWSGKTRMNCVSKVVKQTMETAYSHHIQRLMVTGNLALLMGINPIQVHEWYLAVYDDAYEWVELPNTYGMALYADGGLLATKPYAASGNYINKMSDFCKNCSYKVKEKSGEDACPFNYLYWYFLDRNKDKLKNNHRLFMPLRNLEKMSAEKKQLLIEDAEKFIAQNSAGPKSKSY
ncbi:cryptochrome/photolyase family protein [Lentisphaera profundi]|uniref:Cryptochrome/photolyase family protein n=1 Tax=Lentisphaera profundi TaxID=1658616 RepID=A0ABY7VNR3_9BACT|nr:cryptochrome/photolyase family protein [Lentisphaera profundi]WDE95314.1 cryptochrome/photolyase family protein [Lentisphaera profundi]